MHAWNEKLVLYNSVFAAHAALSGSAKKVEPNAPTNFKAVLHDLGSLGAQIPPVIANTAKTLDLDRMIERGEHAKALHTLAKFTQEDCSKPLCTLLVETLSASCSVLLRNHMGACSGNRLLEAEKALREFASFAELAISRISQRRSQVSCKYCTALRAQRSNQLERSQSA